MELLPLSVLLISEPVSPTEVASARTSLSPRDAEYGFVY